MTFELIRQLAATYGGDAIFDAKDPTKIIVPGVVLIDEIDAHLHPTWQRRVGRWFREHFPRIQFIVTTHSPLICQAAKPGSVFRLPRPGSEEKAGMVTGTELDRLLYGNVLDAYGTGAFGDVVTRSPEALELLERLATLNQKELAEGLSAKEKKEQRKLRTMLPTAAGEGSEDDE
ncbi:AAA family ATPase [Sorangium sp. So ce281]|uniref:AAA family ATPase n=1 Tax=unclassified Sorangium TaxID=2621164 RepID=UPI003F618BC5